MEEITIVEAKPQRVLGLRKRRAYEEIGTLIRGLFEFAIKNSIEIQSPPIFVCHEQTMEEAEKAFKEKNTYLEVAIPISKAAEEDNEVRCYELHGGKWQKPFTKAHIQD